MIYFTADQHFRHYNIIEYSKRPFTTIEEMEVKMIEAWNNIVAPEDTVYLLGDLCFEKIDTWTTLLTELNGNIILVKGNHDRRQVVEKALEINLIQELHLTETKLNVGEITLRLSHKPLDVEFKEKEFNIHGHIHELEEEDHHKINVCVDSPFAKSIGKPFGTPISLEELINYIKQGEDNEY